MQAQTTTGRTRVRNGLSVTLYGAGAKRHEGKFGGVAPVGAGLEPDLIVAIPAGQTANAYRSMALLRAGEMDQAILELQKAQTETEFAVHLVQPGDRLQGAGTHGDAIRQLERMVELVPDELVSHYNLGSLYSQTGRPAEALRQFETASELDPELAAPWFRMYNYYRLSGDKAKAARTLATFQAVRQREESLKGINTRPDSEVAEDAGRIIKSLISNSGGCSEHGALRALGRGIPRPFARVEAAPSSRQRLQSFAGRAR